MDLAALTLNQPHVNVSRASIRIYMGVIIQGANTSYINFCLFKQIPMASRGLKAQYVCIVLKVGII